MSKSNTFAQSILNDGSQEIIITQEQVIEFLYMVYDRMVFGLILTGILAWLVSMHVGQVEDWENARDYVYYILVFETFLVIAFKSLAKKANANKALLLFIIHSIALGVSLALIFAITAGESIAPMFFAIAGAFAFVSIFYRFGMRELSAKEFFVLISAICIVLNTALNIFLDSTLIYWIISCAGVLMYSGIIALDTEKVRILSTKLVDEDELQRISPISGALALYLDFINVFIIIGSMFPSLYGYRLFTDD